MSAADDLRMAEQALFLALAHAAEALARDAGRDADAADIRDATEAYLNAVAGDVRAEHRASGDER
jgi:hypothetical protein